MTDTPHPPPPPPPPETTSEGRGARGRKPWSKPAVRSINALAGTDNGPKTPLNLTVYEGAPQNPYPNYQPQSVVQAS